MKSRFGVFLGIAAMSFTVAYAADPVSPTDKDFVAMVSQGGMFEVDAGQVAAFDTAYLRDMEVIHSKDGAAFAKEAKDGSNADLRAFAAETHRIVLRHIGELRAIGPKST